MAAPAIDLQGRIVVITGASSGIGEQATRAFAKRGAKLAIGARRLDRLQGLARELEAQGAEAEAVELDVTDRASVSAFAKAVEARLGGVDVLIPNAGVAARGPVASLDPDVWDRAIATNLTGAFLTCRAFLPLMAHRPGVRDILVIASAVATVGVPGSSAYTASKWGLRGFAQSLALEVADQGIRVVTLMPGFVHTPWHSDHPRAAEMVQVEDLAHLLVELASLPPSMHLDEVPVWPRAMYSD